MSEKSEQTVAVIGSGAAGLSAAWLLGRSSGAGPKKHISVTLFEKDDRLGGHAHTAQINGRFQNPDKPLAVDTGFIVFNELNYPNFTAWMKELGVQTDNSEMSFAVSRDNGDFEYKGGELSGLFAQPSIVTKPRFWRMLRDLVRFYRTAKRESLPGSDVTLRAYLEEGGYGKDFVDDHLLPFGSAIWSTSRLDMLDYPAAAFIKFCDNHGLLNINDRPQWKTVSGGSISYVRKVLEALSGHRVQLSTRATSVIRHKDCVEVIDGRGDSHHFDQVVFATHADQTLDILSQPTREEKRLLGAFAYSRNLAILHTDERFLPKRKKAWSSWNYLEDDSASESGLPTISYWMNRLQSIDSDTNYIVTLNPSRTPQSNKILRTTVYEHPVFTVETARAQETLWSLQGQRRTWYCGAYFGAGFHEDAIQSGFAVAESITGSKRPWTLENPSSRIVVNNPYTVSTLSTA